ncbi:hypothetical protein [Streptomyces sp. NBC_00316]|uniref:hypothetical protein n=1 Tax=Streptomyces sp. NBC_00316 TaxID=2975710 RepID=UPI002E2DF6F0|nr:hypothetical protein [Streptomyces sp. NBC_00316]
MRTYMHRHGTGIRVAVTLTAAAAIVGGFAPRAVALPDGLGTDIIARGDSLAREAVAEATREIVALGRFDMNQFEGVSRIHHDGVTGGGPRIPPQTGTAHPTAGGDRTIASGRRLPCPRGLSFGPSRARGV